jgi:hypothetical protein
MATPKNQKKMAARPNVASKRDPNPDEKVAPSDNDGPHPGHLGSAGRKSAPPPAMMPESERAWKLAQLAVTLVSNLLKESPPHGMPVNPRLSKNELDPLFAAALKRADSLLSWAEGKGGDIYAYQLFEEDFIKTELELVEIFKTWNWDGLKSKQPIMDLMRDIRLQLEEQLRTEQELYDKIVGVGVRELQEEIAGSIGKCFARHIGQPVKDFEPRLTDIVESITASIDEKLYEHFSQGNSTESFYAFHREQSFFKWCFPDPSAGQQAERLYRPHAIFRRCATRGLFSDRLIRPRHKLNPALIPFPPDDLRHEVFSTFDAHVDREIRSTVSEGQENPPATGR